MMKSVAVKFTTILFLLMLFAADKAIADGCSNSQFDVQYSPWCDCWQVCGNYISDCSKSGLTVTWNFGDGTTYSGGFPCHQYAQPGVYTITMTVRGYCHNPFWKDQCQFSKTINTANIPPPLTADFAADTVCLEKPNGMEFTNFSIYPPVICQFANPNLPACLNQQQGSVSWFWDFGDGSTSTQANPFHVYDSCGAYDVMLIVTHTTPCCFVPGRDTTYKRVFVNCPPNAESNQLGLAEPYIVESSASLNVLSTTCLGDTTNFSLDLTGPVTWWEFHFPDSSTSNSQNPSFVYTACPPAVDYTKVILETDRGCRTTIDSITGVFCPSNIALSATTTLCTGQCSGTATATISGGGTPPFSILWSDPAGQTTFTATQLCPGGPYNVTVTDGNNCKVTPAQGIDVPDFPFAFVGTIDVYGSVPCYGWVGGSAVLNMGGGTPPYSYQWSTGETTDDVQDLPGGTHGVTATDANGCTFSIPVVVPEPPPIGASFTTVNAGCNLCNGSATANPTGGSGNYIYRWLTSPVQTTQTATGLCAGIYQVIVEDANVWMCNDTFTVAISENGAQPITASVLQNATCVNVCDGQAQVTLTGGCANPPCSIAWLDSLGNPIGQTAATSTNLCPGKYTVRVTNASGCRTFADVNITVPNPVIATATASPNTCGGNCNGSITATGSGGSGTYTYAWYDGSGNLIPGQTGAQINNLCAGNYTIQLTDQQGCIATADALIFSSNMTATASVTPAKCNGDCASIVTATVSWGVQPYSFLLQDGGGNTVYSGGSSIMANLCAGTYTLEVSDAANCIISIPVNVSEPPALVAVPAETSPLCFGDCNGSVSVAVSGGTAPYTYEWKSSGGTTIGTTSSVSNLCTGTYSIQVTDANFCLVPFTPITLTQPDTLSLALDAVDPYCYGGQGYINLAVTGGTTPYSFSWNNGASTTQNISGLPTGTYWVEVTDDNGCSKSDTVTFVSHPMLDVTLSTQNYGGGHQFKCNDDSSGYLYVYVTGGIPPYNYQWNDIYDSTTDTVFGVPPGTYTVTVTDMSGCVYVDSITLDLIPPPYSMSVTFTNPTCEGFDDGTITVDQSGGATPYHVLWEHDTTLITNTLTGLAPGTYVTYAFDANTCILSDSVVITEPPGLQSSLAITDVTCNGGNDGAVDLTVSGGTIPYNFSWNGGLFNTEDITGLDAGQYIVDITDSNGCILADTAVVNEPPPIQVSITPQDVNCFEGADGSAITTISGGTTPYSYSWNNSDTTKDLSAVPSGNYSVTVTDANSCETSETVFIDEPALITGYEAVSVCINDSFYVGGGYQAIPGLYYDTLVALNGCDSVLETNLSFITEYLVPVSEEICFGQSYLFGGKQYSSSGIYVDSMLSSGGCDSIITLTLAVFPEIGLYAVPDSAGILYGESVDIALLNNPNVSVVSYDWTPVTGLDCWDCPSVTASPLNSTDYLVVVMDSNGCYDTVTVSVITKGAAIFVPNVFTPNGDGINDEFKVYGRGFVTFRLRVFDRWGEKVYESTDPDAGWDGTFKGEQLNPGVFAYYIEVQFINDDVPPEYILYKKGSVTLVR